MDRRTTSVVRPGLAALACSFVLAVAGLAWAPAGAAPLSGGLSPTVYGGLADLDGDREVGAADDSSAFYGDTSIVDGGLDCDAWAADNDGAQGDGTIDENDACTLIGYDGSPDGVVIEVVAGGFVTADGAPIADGQDLPTVFNAADPDDPSVLAADFAWSTIDGRVDANGDETIDGEDCSFGVVGDADVLGSDPSCGFGGTIDPSLDGLVDLDSDLAITGADKCLDGCFLGHNVVAGLVDDAEPCTVLGTAASETLRGTPARDVICGLGGADILVGGGGRDLIKGGRGDDLMKGKDGPDTLLGGAGPDTARGGPGRDRCRSAVVQRSCER